MHATTMSSLTWVRSPPIMLDHAAYPHIMEAILAYAEPAGLRALGRTSRHFRAVTDKLLAPHTLHLSLRARRTALYTRWLYPLTDGSRRPEEELVLSAPGWTIREAGMVAMLNGSAPRLRRALVGVRVLNADLAMQLGSEWETLATFLPNAALRVGNETPGNKSPTWAPTWGRSPAPTLVLFHNDTLDPVKMRYSRVALLSHPQRRRAVVNFIGADDGAWFHTLWAILSSAWPPQLVINFGRLGLPDWENREARYNTLRPMHQSRLVLLLADHPPPAPRPALTLVGFERVWTWLEAGNGFRAGELIEDPDELRACVMGYVASRGQTLRSRLRILSPDEYRTEVGEEQFAIDTVWE